MLDAAILSYVVVYLSFGDVDQVLTVHNFSTCRPR